MNIQNFKWTDANFVKLAKLSEQGLSARVIGERLGVTRNAVIGQWHRHPELTKGKAPVARKKITKEEKAKRAKAPYTPEMVATAVKRWRAGASAFEIAESIGKTESQFMHYAHVHRDKFPPRKRGPRKKAPKVIAKTVAEPDCIDPSIFLPPAGYDADRLSHGKELHELTRRCCHWPLNNGGPFIFCAASTQVINGYCEHHRVRSVKARVE